MVCGIIFSFCQFESLQDLVSRCLGIREALQSGCELFEFVVAKVTVGGAGSQNQIVIRNRDVLAVGGTYKDALLVFVYSGDLTQNHDGVLLLTKNSADGSRNLAGSEDRRRHLV